MTTRCRPRPFGRGLCHIGEETYQMFAIKLLGYVALIGLAVIAAVIVLLPV